MKNNTIVTIANQNYFWGALLLVASVRQAGMDEPIHIFQSGFTAEMKNQLAALGDVTIFEADSKGRSLTCLKPEAMLSANTDYITWVDSDGYFNGNVSELMIPSAPDKVHLRLRSAADNKSTFESLNLYAPDDVPGNIPQHILQVWQQDVHKLAGTVNSTPKNATCAVACILAFHKNSRPFLEAWKQQMATVLPQKNVGVVDKHLSAYRQLDESVLNSLLCFWPQAPLAEDYRLDKNRAKLFLHVVGIPKPWEWWSKATYKKYYVEIMRLVDWIKEQNLPDLKIPRAFNRKYAFFHKHCSLICLLYRILRKLSLIFNR